MVSRRLHNLFLFRSLSCLAFLAALCLTFSGLNAQEPHAAEGAAHSAEDRHTLTDHGDEKPTIWADLAFWSIIAFAGFCFAIVKLGLWDSLVTNMSQREQHEIQLIATAEGHLASAKAVLNQYRGQLEAMEETVVESLAEAKRDAQHTQSEIVELANCEASLMLVRAKHEIDRSRDQTLNRLFEHLSRSVAAATEASVRANLVAADQDRLIDDTLSQLAVNS